VREQPQPLGTKVPEFDSLWPSPSEGRSVHRLRHRADAWNGVHSLAVRALVSVRREGFDMPLSSKPRRSLGKEPANARSERVTYPSWCPRSPNVEVTS
jgi:hypothetical protein